LVHDLHQRVRRAVGPGRRAAAAGRAHRDRGAAGQGVRSRRRGRRDRQLLRQAPALQDHRIRGGGVPAVRARGVHRVSGRWLMLPAQAPTAYVGTANVIAVLILLAEFGMFRQALLRDQIRLYAAQSVLIAGLAVLVAAVRQLPELYVLGAATVALK